MATSASQRKRERALEEFRQKIAELSAEEIRTMLAERRIRSPERIALAEAMIGERGLPKTGARGNGQAADEAAAARERPSAEAEATAESAKEPEAPIEQGPEAEEEPAKETEVAGPEAAPAAAIPLAREVGRYLGIGIGIAGLAALVLMVIRR